MATPVVKVKRIDKKALFPQKMTDGSVGLDIASLGRQVLWTGIITKVRTGLAVAIPKGYHGEIHIRSSLGIRGIRLANCTGIIDSDYRGEIMLVLINDSNVVQHISEGERIAQLILVKDPVYTVTEVDELDDTERGEGGFGSTND